MPISSELQGVADGVFSFAGGMNPVLGNIMAGMKNAEASKKKEALVNDYSTNLDTWYNKRMNQDFLDSNAANSVLTRIGEQLKNRNNIAEKQAATTGATNEATLAAKTANQGQHNDVVSRLAAMGTAREDQVEGRYMNQLPQIFQMKTGILDDKIAAAQTQAANSNETMNSMLSLGANIVAPGSGTAFTAMSGNPTMASNQIMQNPIDTTPIAGANDGLSIPFSDPTIYNW